MNKFIGENDKGIEVGAGAGLSKKFILNKNLKISDFSNGKHLDHKNIDAQNTGFTNNSYDFVIAANMSKVTFGVLSVTPPESIILRFGVLL